MNKDFMNGFMAGLTTGFRNFQSTFDEFISLKLSAFYTPLAIADSLGVTLQTLSESISANTQGGNNDDTSEAYTPISISPGFTISLATLNEGVTIV